MARGRIPAYGTLPAGSSTPSDPSPKAPDRGTTIAMSGSPVRTEPGPADARGRDPILLIGAIAGAVAATLLLGSMIRPLEAGAVGFDSAGSVIHFDRIMAGQHLEAFVTVTPKPWLTLVYGVIHALLPDWRAISLAALGAFGLAVALAVLLVGRAVPAAPRWVAIVATPLLLVASPRLDLDTSLAYAVPWALVWWMVAGIAALGPRPRPWLVGLALMLATLARLETVSITAVLALALVIQLLRTRRGMTPANWTVQGLAIATALAITALPVMLVHDWLLTGNPWFWLSVSARFSDATAAIPSPSDVKDTVVAIARLRPLPSLAAVLGLILLWRQGQRALVLGLLALGPGLGLLLVGLAVRGTYVSSRYFAGVEVALMVAAALGAAGLVAEVARWSAAWRGARPGATMALAGIGVAIVVGGVVFGASFAPRVRSVTATMREQTAIALIGDRAVPVVRPLLAGHDLVPGAAAPPDSGPWLYVPTLLRPRLAVDLDLPLWAVAGTNPSILEPSASPRAGAVIVHSRAFDAPAGAYAALETGHAVTVGGLQADTVALDGSDGWILVVR